MISSMIGSHLTILPGPSSVVVALLLSELTTASPESVFVDALSDPGRSFLNIPSLERGRGKARLIMNFSSNFVVLQLLHHPT
jgi:hypothetical protein